MLLKLSSCQVRPCANSCLACAALDYRTDCMPGLCMGWTPASSSAAFEKVGFGGGLVLVNPKTRRRLLLATAAGFRRLTGGALRVQAV